MSPSNENNIKNTYFTQSLRKICVEDQNNEASSDCVYYKSKRYKKLFPFCFETLHFDLIANEDFYLETLIDDNGIGYITLSYSTKRRRRPSSREDRLRILSMGFNGVQDYDIDQPQLIQEISSKRNYYITYKLYEMLREQHSINPTPPTMSSDEQHTFLSPVLRKYQKAAVDWLLFRENVQDNISGIYQPVSCRDNPEITFYLNNITLALYTFKPAEIIVPSGGILADEMGLGKTVEMLALILSNARELPTIDNMPEVNISEKLLKLNENLLCVCPKKRKVQLISCVKCNVQQHSYCVRKYSTDSDHICPDCWKKMGLYESGATIIVSPEPIKMQWYSEIMKHSKKPLKVLLYTGISKMRWISPAELANYDIVLIDYGVLRSEIYFANEKPTRNLRRMKTYMQVTTPLVMVRWWRVCLDEAQMVEQTSSKASQMVKNLPAIHRWAVTGTPIQKSVEDLRGLLDFLDLAPFDDSEVFRKLVHLFQRGCSKPLLNVLSKVMWRTCKVAVLDQLNIPPQTEEVRYVTLSDAERLHYQSQHQLCFANFEERVRKLASSSSTSKIEPRTLQMLLEPLRKLRQDCTVPVLLQKSDETVVKRLLQPAELLEHLRVTNEIDCKTKLRTIASSYNGLGALHFIRGEFEEATKCYEAVLRRAKDYTGAISVDSLLQIHALDNLLKAHEADIAINETDMNNVEQIEVYRNQCDKLEWKYIETYRSNLTKAQQSYSATLNTINELRKKLSKHAKAGMWWRNLLHSFEIKNCADQLFARINDEKRSSYSSSLLMDFYSRHAIDYTLTTWAESLFECRKNVIKAFDQFKSFINNVKPKDELDEGTQKLLKKFVKNTFDCHLKEILNDKINDEENSIDESPETIILCQLCEAKRALADLECKLFNKQLDERTERVRGVENPSLQETILKIICSFAKVKNLGAQDVKDGEIFLQLIESMKKEFKEFGKVWIETEYTVKAYDELDMCKLRLQAIDPENLKKDKNKLIYNISKEEIDLMFDEFKINLKTAEVDFIRKSARLKYLKHLEKQSDPEICPICTTMPESKYCMLECGHHMCLSCLSKLAKYGTYIKCSVCRNRQKYQDVYYVTYKVDVTDGISIKGFYSSKIEEIVRAVLKLKIQDENVKILIFSQWEGILRVISNALIENGVKIVQRKSTKNVDEFKDPELGITCLLLLLSHGSKGLNLVEATHVFLVEPILNPGEELQAIGRVHRIGQTRPTVVHRFISTGTVEETIFDTVYGDQTKKWELNNVTIDNIRVLLSENNIFDPTLEMTID